MAHTDAVGDSVALPNYAGELFIIGNSYTRTPLLSMTGGLTGGRTTGTDTFIMGNFITLDAASQSFCRAETDTITAPASDIYAPAQLTNFIELQHRLFTITYKKRSMASAIGGESVVGEGIVDMGDPSKQREAFLAQLAKDLEYSMLLGQGVDPATAATAGKTRGVITAMVADGNTVVDASGGVLTKDLVNELEEAVLDQTGSINTPVIMGSSFQIQRLTELYGYAPESASIGGVTLRQINLPTIGACSVVYDPALTGSTNGKYLALLDVSKIAPVFLPDPVFGSVFFEPLGKTGAAVSEQLYCQFGVDYTSPIMHGCIKNLATSL